jgi:hypothetical protein
MTFAFLAPLAFVFAGAYAGDLPTDFQAVLKQNKGPFGQNILQGTTERISVTAGRVPVGYLFQAAYRNDLARALVVDHRLYIGNLFTTNYYELMGEYVYGDPFGTHPEDHAALAAQSAAALPKASLIIQNWALEKHYIEQRPDSKLARSFKIRGISSYENELTYAKHFFNFYLGAIEDDFQYLPAFLLATKSPIYASASLARARDLIALAYQEVSTVLGTTEPMVKALWKLRNSIHNQLTPAVIQEIDRFLATYPQYRTVPPPPPTTETTGEWLGVPTPVTVATEARAEVTVERTDLDEIRKILVEYYAISPKRLAEQARKSGQADLKAAAESILRNGVNAQSLLHLSTIAAGKRELLAKVDSVPYEKRAEVLALLANVSLYVRKELVGLSNVRSPQVVESVVNAVYLEGFLIRDNWIYFKSEIARSADLAKVLTDVIEVGGEVSLREAFGETLEKWKLLDRKMQYFVDNTLKSSAIDTAAVIAQRLKP